MAVHGWCCYCRMSVENPLGAKYNLKYVAFSISNLEGKPCASIRSTHISNALSIAAGSSWEASCDFWRACVLHCDCTGCSWEYHTFDQDPRRKYLFLSAPPRLVRYRAISVHRSMLWAGSRRGCWAWNALCIAHSVLGFLGGGCAGQIAIPVPVASHFPVAYVIWHRGLPPFGLSDGCTSL